MAEHGSGARRHSGHFVGRKRLGKYIVLRNEYFCFFYHGEGALSYRLIGALTKSITLAYKNQTNDMTRVDSIELLSIFCRQARPTIFALIGTRKKSRTLDTGGHGSGDGSGGCDVDGSQSNGDSAEVILTYHISFV